jgi:hypothetical protein
LGIKVFNSSNAIYLSSLCALCVSEIIAFAVRSNVAMKVKNFILEELKEMHKKDKPSLLKTVGEMINLGTKISPYVMKYLPMIETWIKTL